MSTRIRWILATVGALALAALVIGTEMPWLVADADHPSAVAGEACPADAKKADLDYTLKDVNGKDVTLASFAGKVILLDFWATWCGPCKVEIPYFMDLQTTYGSRGFQAIGVSVDDTPDKLTPYVREMKMNYPVLQGLGQDAMLDAYGPIIGIPVTMIISRDGKICVTHTGMGTKELFENAVKSLL